MRARAYWKLESNGSARTARAVNAVSLASRIGVGDLVVSVVARAPRDRAVASPVHAVRGGHAGARGGDGPDGGKDGNGDELHD